MFAKILEAIIAIGSIVAAIVKIFKRSTSKDVMDERQKSHQVVEEFKKTGRPSE